MECLDYKPKFYLLDNYNIIENNISVLSTNITRSIFRYKNSYSEENDFSFLVTNPRFK